MDTFYFVCAVITLLFSLPTYLYALHYIHKNGMDSAWLRFFFTLSYAVPVISAIGVIQRLM